MCIKENLYIFDSSLFGTPIENMTLSESLSERE